MCSILRSCGGRDSGKQDGGGDGGGEGKADRYRASFDENRVQLTEFIVTEVEVLHSCQLNEQLQQREHNRDDTTVDGYTFCARLCMEGLPCQSTSLLYTL